MLCDLVSRTLGEMALGRSRVTTLKLDTIAREFILDNGVNPPARVIRVFPERCVSR